MTDPTPPAGGPDSDLPDPDPPRGNGCGPLEEVCTLPGGYMLYRQRNEVGGYAYWTDQIGGGVMVWDTSIVDPNTLLIAMSEEIRRSDEEDRRAYETAAGGHE